MQTPAAFRAIPLALILACLLAGGGRGVAQVPAQDVGAAGAWQKLRKLRTTASVMHTTAHPDDEHGGVLAMLSRGGGARVSLLTLTRGESGDNAIGSELFEGLGLLRTEELRVSNRYYGVDRQYFGTVVDYGFSKRLDEAIEKWTRDHVLRDVVGVIRTERPFVLISRFQGNQRDGHGNHAAAGLVTREAFKLAGDPRAFPEQIASGLRPWQPLKLYIGGVRENEHWTIRVDAGKYDPVLGNSYQSIARQGLAFQRSQNSGRVASQPGPAVSFYERIDSLVEAPAREESFFDGIDTTIPGLYRALRKTEPAGAAELLIRLDRELEGATAAFKFDHPSAAAPALARALAAVRQAATGSGIDEDVEFVLRAKEVQIAEALHAVLGIDLSATARPAGSPESTGPFSAGPPPMPPVVPGQTFEVRAAFTNRSDVELRLTALTLESVDRAGPWTIALARPPSGDGHNSAGPRIAAPNQPVVDTFSVTVPENATLARPLFSRPSIRQSRYEIADEAQRYGPSAEPPLHAVARYEVEGVSVEKKIAVTRLEANLPYGHDTRQLAVVPALALTMTPARAIVPMPATPARQRGATVGTIALQVELLNNRDRETAGALTLKAPPGWSVVPASQPFRFLRAGERALYSFEVRIPSLEDREYRIEAVATAGGRDYREGYTTIRHRDLETRYLYRDAATSVRGIDVAIASGLKVGYVMGVGDEVPTGLRQLGADVQLLGEADLASGDLGRFNTIITGTRAYAVREDLKTYNQRLLDYVQAGGNLIVLYNTQEFVPDRYAPHPGTLSARAEEVSEEDSPVEILAPGHQVLTTPNRISAADFEDWVEQRGSKFWDAWDGNYTTILATWDTGQAPQRGGWLHTRHGKGHYTYFAYALHRQLPYGVSGAYRLLANLLSLNRAP